MDDDNLLRTLQQRYISTGPRPEYKDYPHKEETDLDADITEAECAVAAITDLELPSKLYLMEGIVVNILKNFGFGQIASAMFEVCKTVGGIMDTVDNLSFGIVGSIIDPVKKLLSLLPVPDCSANSIKGTVKCGNRISVKLPSSLNAKECFKHVSLTCIGSKANKGPALVDLFETISCLSGKAFDATTPEGITGLACSVLTGWAKSARVIDIKSLLPFPLPIPLPGLGGSSSSTSEDGSKGLVSDVLGAITDPLGILTPNDDDSGGNGLISNVLGAVTDPLGILKPHDDDSGGNGLISNVLGAVTDPLGILTPHDDDSGGNGLISNVLSAVTDPLGILKPNDDDSGGNGLISNVLGAVTDPLGILKPHDDDSSGDKPQELNDDSTTEDKQPHGLLSNVFGIVQQKPQTQDQQSQLMSLPEQLQGTPQNQTSFSEANDQRNPQSEGGAANSNSKVSAKPKGLLSGLLGGFLGPDTATKASDQDESGSLSTSSEQVASTTTKPSDVAVESPEEVESETANNSNEPAKPTGLLSGLLGGGLFAPHTETKTSHQDGSGSQSTTSEEIATTTAKPPDVAVESPEGAEPETDDNSKEPAKPKGLLSGLLGGLHEPDTVTKTSHQDEPGSESTSSEHIATTTTKPPDVVVESPVEAEPETDNSKEPDGLLSGLLGGIFAPHTASKTSHQDESGFQSTSPQQVASTTTKPSYVAVSSEGVESELANSKEPAKPAGLLSGLLGGGLFAPHTETKTSHKDESGSQSTSSEQIATTTTKPPDESPGEAETETENSSKEQSGLLSGLLGGIFAPLTATKTSHQDESGSQSTSSEQMASTTTKPSYVVVESPEEVESETENDSKEPVKPKGLLSGLLGGGLFEPDKETKISHQDESGSQSTSTEQIATTTTKPPDVTVESPEEESEIDNSKEPAKPKGLLSGLLGGLLVPDTATKTSDQNESVSDAASNKEISTSTTKQPDVAVESSHEPEAKPEDKSKEKTKPKGLLSGLFGGLLG
ncbi:uncharacterized protein LOC119398532 [Rhipicephalus sanguineus]|uniref:uncharacterized protein LOC119398532 n=1 Tax=Rhipicephalus sanguineus TaxID=34632 RepID=UPI001893E667|nr:uncharacterized protein LOC119398532 [Rhipicephalus sanguineus]